MTLFFHEMKQNARMLIIWSVAVGAMIVLCMITFPEMEKQAGEIGEMFSTMGGFTAAFGMDKISIADPLGFYGIEGGAILGLGGALFAAFIGVRMLSKEETEHTAEFLLTHPVRRVSVITGKLGALVAQIVIFNLFCILCALASFAFIDEELPGKAFWLFHLAQCILQLEVAFVCFGASAFLKRGSVGFGLGIAALLYFLNIIANISPETEFVRYISPFSYADAAVVIPDVAINLEYLAFGIAYGLIGVVIAYVWYSRKDIAV